MVPYLGDFAEDATVYIPFNTFDSNDPSASATITNLADADIKVHKDGSATEIVTDGATVAIDFDTITGNHLITIDTSVDAAYSTGSDYLVRIEGTTVDGATINAFVASFSIQNRYSAGALRPTTAGRTLDVTATGAAGIDWGNVENQGTSVDLSATSTNLVDTATTATTATNLTNLPSIPANWITTAGITDGAFTAAKFAASSLDGKGDWNVGKTGYTLTATTGLGNQTANITGTLSGTVGGIAGTIQTLDALDTAQDTQHSTTQSNIAALNDIAAADVWAVATRTLTANTNLNDPTAAAIADAVWDEAQADHVGVGTFGVTASEIADILVDTGTTIPGVLGTPAGADLATDVAAVKSDTAAVLDDTGTSGVLLAADQGVDVTKISGSAAAADNLEAHALAVITGTTTGTPSTTSSNTDLTGYANDELIGRVIVFTGGTAAGQASDITDYVSVNGVVTYTAITTAPAASDTFVIV